MTEPSSSRSDDGRLFPVLCRRADAEKVFVPWSLVAPHEKQALKNHDQTLERLAQRGGLAPCELVAVLEGRDWHSMSDAESWGAIFKAATFRSERGAMPQGWRFNTADFSITPGSVMLMRDEAGKKWWFSLSEETQEEVSLYVSARGNTFDEAMSAVCKLAAELPGPTRPSERNSGG